MGFDIAFKALVDKSKVLDLEMVCIEYCIGFGLKTAEDRMLINCRRTIEQMKTESIVKPILIESRSCSSLE